MFATMLSDFVATVEGWSTAAVFLRLLLACLAGVIVGLNREFKNKGAGIKTHVLVCVGSALAMVVNEYIMVAFPEASTDVSRIGAQVISGVGFLGVGTIIVTGRNEVRGLTTAAGLWACACIGLAAGIGFVEGTLIALLFVLAAFTVLGSLDSKLREYSRTFDLYVEFERSSGAKDLIKTLHGWDCTYSSFILSKSECAGSGAAVTLTIRLPHAGRKRAFIDAVQALDFVSFCDEV